VQRVRLFKTISILLPFLLLGLLELSLRIFHYGHDLRLFIEYPHDNNYLVLNPDASRRYFSDQENATSGNVELFRKKKDPNTLRIFVLGESTTIGYPYFHNGSFHRWLEYRLMHTFPDRNFEIINLSLTAVNSYTILGFSRELVDYEPDAVLIYTGHNEYYGALGVGSTDRIGGNSQLVDLTLWLRQFRVVQLIAKAYDGIVHLFSAHAALANKTRMELMVGEQRIPYGSKLFARGIDQFRGNMDKTLSLFQKHHIPVFLSNLVSNEKDIPPFISAPVDSVQFPGFQKNYERGLKAMEKSDSATAYADFNDAGHAYGGHALCNYYLGRLAYRDGDSGLAKSRFSKARDLDELRFRAPEELNGIIAQLCNTYDNTHLVDAKTAFEAISGKHIIGDELVLEHVHPNLYGYALLSDVFYTTMKTQGLFAAPKGTEMSFPRLLASMPITKVDSLTGVYKIWKLKSSWPFNGRPETDSLHVGSEEEELAFDIAFKHMPWESAMSNLYDYYIKERDLEGARTVMETLLLEYPTEEVYYDKTANLYGELKQYDNALFYFKKAFALAPSFEKARYVFVLALKLDRPADALPFLDYAVQNNTSGANLAPVKHFAEEVIQLQREAASDSTNPVLFQRIADAYAKMGNKEGAEKYAEKAQKMQGHL
jgi:tetratricopeptide (TPR) repeat protein